MPHVNVEIKARCRDAEAVRRILRARGADFRGVDHQLDTYFRVEAGRLKLREGDIENHLIYYERPNRPGPKRADVRLLPAEPGGELKRMLTEAIGVLAVVDKRREIYFIDNVKFHVDEVDGLGHFVEIEAQAAVELGAPDPESDLRAQCQAYLDLLAVDPDDLVSESYSDLILARADDENG